MKDTYRIFFYEDLDSTADKVIECLTSSPAKPYEPNFEVRRYAYAADALRAIDNTPRRADAALLDLGEPDYVDAGVDICTRLREKWNDPPIPVIFLSRHYSGKDIIGVRKAGAIDHLPKTLEDDPDFKEALRTVIYQTIGIYEEIMAWEPGKFAVGSLEVNRDDMKVFWRNNPVDLHRSDVFLLYQLAKHPGQVQTYDKLIREGGISGDDRTRRRNNLRKRIESIRRAFNEVDEGFWVNDNREPAHGIVARSSSGYYWKPDA